MTKGHSVRLRVGAVREDREVEFALPESWEVMLCPPGDLPAMTPEAVGASLDETVGCEPLSVQARGVDSAVLLVDDFRRPTPAEMLCHAVIDRLEAGGLAPGRVSVVLGGGAHRPMTPAEVQRRLGTVPDRVGRVVAHDAFSPEVRYLGLTESGTPVLVNEVAAGAELSISISTVYPHNLVSWGGGAKMVLPGISHVSTIHFHHGRLNGGTWAGPPQDSPARRDLEQAARLFGLNVSVCAVVNSRKELCGLVTGEPQQAHAAAVAVARRVGETPAPAAPPDLIIANAYPMDADGTQYNKAQMPVREFKCPVLVMSDFADPSTYHGLYDGPLEPYLRRPEPEPPPRTEERLMKAPVFFYSPQYGRGFLPPDKSWYGDHDWDRLLSDLARRFPRARVAVYPVAPLQIPRVRGEQCGG